MCTGDWAPVALMLGPAQVGLNILGVVENMSGLQQPLASMRFMSQAEDGEPARDVTQQLLALLKGSALDADSIVAQSDVFKPTKGGAESMAADMGIPFLGRVPLDPALSLAGLQPHQPASSTIEPGKQGALYLPPWSPLDLNDCEAACCRAAAFISASVLSLSLRCGR